MPEIVSVPASFTLSTTPVPGYDDQVCTFAIPAGTWIGGVWHTEGVSTLFPSQAVETAGGAVALGIASGAYSLMALVSAAQLDDINAAAGGNLSATLIDTLASFGTDAVSLFTLTLLGSATCDYAIAPESLDYSYLGGSGEIAVETDPACVWSAVTLYDWITITDGESGTGDGTVEYSVAANPGPARTGTILVAGLTHTVNQDAEPEVTVENGQGGDGVLLKPFEEGGTHLWYARLGYPDGYRRYDLDALVTWAEYHAMIVHAGGLRARVDAGLLILYGSDGNELSVGATCPDVDIVRFGHP